MTRLCISMKILFLFMAEMYAHTNCHHRHGLEKIWQTYTQLNEYLDQIPGNKALKTVFKSSFQFVKNLDTFYQILLSISFISFIPTLFLICIPYSGNQASLFLRCMISFAAGCLLGDAVLHLIPHAYENSAPGDGEVGLFVLLGILIFYLIDRIVSLPQNCRVKTSKTEILIEKFLAGKDGVYAHAGKLNTSRKTEKVDNSPNAALFNSSAHVSKVCSATKTVAPSTTCGHIRSFTVLSVLADFIHNFSDGVAIASTFFISPSAGFSTSVSVFFHEIPHEISDFAILIKSGVSKRKFLTSLGAYLGALLVYFLGKKSGTDNFNYIISITAGGFIYIACANIIPEIMKDIGSFFHLLIETFSVVAGTLVLRYF